MTYSVVEGNDLGFVAGELLLAVTMLGCEADVLCRTAQVDTGFDVASIAAGSRLEMRILTIVFFSWLLQDRKAGMEHVMATGLESVV